MTIIIEQKDKAATLHIVGRIDTVTSPELEKTLADLPAEITELTLDMKEVAYISSAGLRVLLGTQKKMNECGSSMKLVGVCETVTEVLQMTGFADILEIE